MGGAHSHHSTDLHVETSRTPRLVLLAGLALAAVATVVGLVVLWPNGDRPHADYAAPGTKVVQADVVKVYQACPVVVSDPSLAPDEAPQQPDKCNELKAELDSGRQVIVQAGPGATQSGLRSGDRVSLLEMPGASGRSPTYAFFGTVRKAPVGILLGVFALVVLAVARLRGLLALVGLGLAGVVVGVFAVPALLEGESPVPVALVGAAAIMFAVLYLAHGPTIRTSTALAGTLVGVLITAALGSFAVGWTRLSGLNEAGDQLRAFASSLDFQALMVCAIVIAGLGVLNDVTITQSSAVWELRAASPAMSRRALFASAMRIGRDHIASTIYTIVFVYAGTALLTLLLASLYERSLLDQLLTEDFSEEVVMTLASSIGLVLAMPATTAIAVLTVSGPAPART